MASNTAFLTTTTEDTKPDAAFEQEVETNEAELDKTESSVDLSRFKDVKGIQIVQTLYEDVNDIVGSLSSRVNKALKSQETQLLTDYQDHMQNVARQVKKLKRQLKASESKIKNDTRVITLEKERSWFKREAVRLDELVLKLKEDLSISHAHSQTITEERDWLDGEARNVKRKNKILQDELSIYIKRLQNQDTRAIIPRVENVDVNKPPLNKKAKIESTSTAARPQTSYTPNRYSKKQSRKYLRIFQNAQVVTQQRREHGLKKIFEECIKSVEKDSQRRRILTKLRQEGLKQRKLSFEDETINRKVFKKKQKHTDVERKRIIQRFFMNDKVFDQVYDLVFESDKFLEEK